MTHELERKWPVQLLDVETIRTRLDDEFLGLEPTITGMRLVPFSIGDEAMVSCQESLNVRFPSSFIRIVTRFDFGHFTIGPVAFCNRGDYFSWLTDINNGAGSPLSWGLASRPDGIILIANSDQFALLLNTSSEQVFALEHGDNVSNGSFMVAKDFDLLLRGLGTAFFQRHPNGGNEELARQIASLVSGNPENRFWQWIAA